MDKANALVKKAAELDFKNQQIAAKKISGKTEEQEVAW